ncbi:MAG: glucoamylase family protein [Planctomycetota bacterium]
MRIEHWLPGLVVLTLMVSARADTFTPLASYEPAETDLVVTPSAGDPGLSISIVPGGVDGAPPATDGDYVLKVEITNETDHKVEFRHNWTASTYDLEGHDELLADVYIATTGALPDLMGIWSQNWNPPDQWQAATGIPTTTGVWTTISFNVSSRNQVDLDEIWAFIFEDMAGTSGVAYVDRLRFRNPGSADAPAGVAVNGFVDHNGIVWKPLAASGLEGYNVYRAEAETGPFVQLNSTPVTEALFDDPTTPLSPRYYYYVTAVVAGDESGPSQIASARYNGFTDDQLLDWIQQQTFRYFWDFAHPVSGMARDNLTGWSETTASGGTGMGLMAIVVGIERGFITRAEGADRVLQILTFLDQNTTRYHGAWAHWINGTTGETIPFSELDDGADLVETSYLVQGMLTVRQYFQSEDPDEAEIRARATQMWEEVEWDWFRRYPGSDVLYWHWSPNYGWAMNMIVTGYNEAMITYLLAIASPTYPMPATSFHNGWARESYYTNGNSYYGYILWVGPAYGGPLFFTHYSFLGFDPRYKRDAYCNYFENSRNASLIHQAYSRDNPLDFAGYNYWLWGLTASVSPPPWGYMAHSPTNDNGTIAPTAALSATAFTPAESRAALRYMLDNYTPELTGPYGFYDAFNPELSWFSDSHLAIDQGPIVIMIENHRTKLCWNLFMSNPEIRPMMQSIGMFHEVDFDTDGDIDPMDLAIFAGCFSGPDESDGGCPGGLFDDSDLDNDNDVDLRDAAVFQELFHVP